MEKSKVLLVDDTPANLDVLRKTLESEGFNISVVTSGELALQIAPKFKPDLILLDVMMPGMDGYATCTKLKEDASTRDIPVIFITAKTEVEDIVKGFSVGGVDYVTKPFRQEVVRARVNTHIQLRKLNKAREDLIFELGEKNKILSELNETKNKFLGIAAHDLRNPLSSIRGFSDILLHDKKNLKPDEYDEFMTIISESSNHMLSLVNDLLDYSVIESGKLEVNLKIDSLVKLLERRIKLNEPTFEAKKIKIEKAFSDVPDFMFDANRIAQVIDNLFTNAAKFSPAGSTVTVALVQAGEYAKVSVKDEGPGISESDREKLFSDFQKLSAKPTGGEKSTGLGLAIVKKMVDAHGGIIGVEDHSGPGAIFSFSLPLDVSTTVL